MPTERTALLAQTGRALGAAELFLAAGRARLVVRVAPAGKVEPERFATEQLAAHALAWMASYVEALRQMRNWAVRLDEGGKLGEIEALILETAFGEYLAQLSGGIAMAQGEFARPQDLGLDDGEIAPLRTGAAGSLSAGAAAARLQLGARLAEAGEGVFGDIGIDDPALEMVRDQVRRFAEREVAPHAQEWHRRDALIPLPVIEELARIGVFGMTIPEEHGGLGLGKTAMSIVSEELSRAYIGVGSLGTR
ncbi:MAG TPA: acyl-CoA dehydrogenase family protein, partial [Stellaceae bacterium]